MKTSVERTLSIEIEIPVDIHLDVDRDEINILDVEFTQKKSEVLHYLQGLIEDFAQDEDFVIRQILDDAWDIEQAQKTDDLRKEN